MELSLTLPYPHGVSVNACWSRSKRGVFLNKDVIYYRSEVFVRCYGKTKFKDSKLDVRIDMYPPDNRKRDIDNILKVVLDVLQKADLFEDDCQIFKLYVEKHSKFPAGKLDVLIKSMDN